MLVTRLPDKLAGLPQALTLAGKVVEQQEGTATLRTQAGDVQVRTSSPLPTDRPVTLQVPPQVPGATMRAAALAPLARPAEAQAPAPAAQAQAPTPPPQAQQPVMQPGVVVSAVLVAAPPKQNPPKDPAASPARPSPGGESPAPAASGTPAPAPAPSAGLGLFRPTGGSTGGGGSPEQPQGSVPAATPSQAAPAPTPPPASPATKPVPAAATSFLASLANLPRSPIPAPRRNRRASPGTTPAHQAPGKFHRARSGPRPSCPATTPCPAPSPPMAAS
ncbi:hypothetical protein HHL28_05055 [Aerophototrophica crusticola]|uniref:Uncharacterized protein n=1 Tax=Aerophototrophica crusticola TaxID=1709002 RepID=A0A858R559_9PROT|nr:hypothetical protein HHL28_05055 [Rhodospirillaceae bacterium B3]